MAATGAPFTAMQHDGASLAQTAPVFCPWHLMAQTARAPPSAPPRSYELDGGAVLQVIAPLIHDPKTLNSKP